MRSDSDAEATVNNPLLRGKLKSARVYPEFFSLGPDWSVVNLGCGWGPQAIIYNGQFRRMVGIDVNDARLASSRPALQSSQVSNYAMLCGDVEAVPLQSVMFDAVIAVDIIEHLRKPERMSSEAYRVLKPGGHFMVTFPAMHDHFTHFVSSLASLLGRQRKARTVTSGWDPDAHNQARGLNDWIETVESVGFVLERSRASTLFPPLHLYGVPRFWFTNDAIHAIDRFLCRQRGLKRLGQALVCDFRKP